MNTVVHNAFKLFSDDTQINRNLLELMLENSTQLACAYANSGYGSCEAGLQSVFQPLIRMAINGKSVYVLNCVICAAKRAWSMCNARFSADNMYVDARNVVSSLEVDDPMNLCAWQMYYYLLGNCSLTPGFRDYHNIDVDEELYRALKCCAPIFTIKRLIGCGSYFIDAFKKLNETRFKPNWPYQFKDYVARLLTPQSDSIGGRPVVPLEVILPGVSHQLLILWQMERGISTIENDVIRIAFMDTIRDKQRNALLVVLREDKPQIAHVQYEWILALPQEDELRRLYIEKFGFMDPHAQNESGL